MRGQVFAPLAGALLMLAACSGGSGGSDAPARDPGRALTNYDRADPNGSNSGPGVSGSVARLYSDAAGQIRLDMVDGPMAGMVIFCEDRSGAQCHVNAAGVGATGTGSLSARRKGDYAYVGQFVVNHDQNGTLYANTHSVHGANPARGRTDVRLPDGAQQYNGQFAAGAGVNHENGTSTGMATGAATILANFDTATVSGRLTGALDNGQGPAVNVVFNGLNINRGAASFRSDNTSRIEFQGERAWGEIEGAFYGPDAQEAAGAFSFGNDQGGMSGVFLTCRRGLDCIQPE